MDPIFSRKFYPQWTLTAQCTDGQGGLWGGERVETLIFLYSKKPKQTGRSVSWLLDRDGRNETIQLAKTTLWALLALNFHNPVKGSACCNPLFLTKPLFGQHPCRHWSFVSRQNLPFLVFPPLPTGCTTSLEATLCLLGFSPTYGWGGNLNVLTPSHSSCSCSPLEEGGRVSMASHPFRRSLQMLSPCTQEGLWDVNVLGQKAAAWTEAPWRQAATGRESPVVLNN